MEDKKWQRKTTRGISFSPSVVSLCLIFHTGTTQEALVPVNRSQYKRYLSSSLYILTKLLTGVIQKQLLSISPILHQSISYCQAEKLFFLYFSYRISENFLLEKNTASQTPKNTITRNGVTKKHTIAPATNHKAHKKSWFLAPVTTRAAS